jgi:simple sugar transport system substrate-binding protein
VLVSHAPDSDSWWNTIKNGIALAGEQMGVEVEYRNPPTGDLADMARIIEQAAASGPNGIITTLPITMCCPARSPPQSIPASTSSS